MTHESLSDKAHLASNITVDKSNVLKYFHILMEMLFILIFIVFLYSRVVSIYSVYLSYIFSQARSAYNVKSILQSLIIVSSIFFLFALFYSFDIRNPGWMITALSIFVSGVFFLSFVFSKVSTDYIQDKYRYFNIFIIDFVLNKAFFLFTLVYLYHIPFFGYKLDYSLRIYLLLVTIT